MCLNSPKTAILNVQSLYNLLDDVCELRFYKITKSNMTKANLSYICLLLDFAGIFTLHKSVYVLFL